MPTALEMTREKALSRHPFRNTDARAALKTERMELDIKHATAKRSLTENKEELVTAGNVVNNNAEEATESKVKLPCMTPNSPHVLAKLYHNASKS